MKVPFLEDPGWLINREKWNLTPSEDLCYLGLRVNSITQKEYLQRGKDKEGSGKGCLPSEQPSTFHQNRHVGVRPPGSNNPDSALGKGPFQMSPHRHSKKLGRKSTSLGQDLSFIPKGKEVPNLGMGGPWESKVAHGVLVQGEISKVGQLERIKGYLGSPESICQEGKGSPHPDPFRQCGGGLLHEQTGGTCCPSLIRLASTIFAWAEINLGSVSAVHSNGGTTVWQII